ncbi:MAG: AAA family ATPase [Polaromonas sp.]|nr:AAA family ATPase [Polaromonas sp.]
MPDHRSSPPSPPSSAPEAPLGYVAHRLSCPLADQTPSGRIILLPAQVKTEIDAARSLDFQRRAAEQIREEEQRLHQARAAKLREAHAEAAPDEVEDPAEANTEGKSNASIDFDPSQDGCPAFFYPVYTKAELAAFKSRIGRSADKEVRRRDEDIARLLQAKGFERRIGMPDLPQEMTEELREQMPHFGEVIDFLRDHLVLAAHCRNGSRLPPILLGGEPGIGKTHFAHLLAELLGTAVHRISFDKAVTGPTLTGSERRWSNTTYGLVFEAVCLGKHANPVIVLDEIDKAEARQDWNALAPLHSLLEPATARRSKDISLDFEFDCSEVTWIATANSLARIPDSLRSRFQIFHVERPDARAALAATRWVVQAVFGELDLHNFKRPDNFVAVRLAHLTAREVQHATRKAIARAVADGRRSVTLADLPDGLGRDECTDSGTPGGSQTKEWLH